MIEETYEVVEAIDADDPVLLREELGDALLQIVLHARIEEEAGRATFDEIAGDVCRKMIHRHPHVFGDVKAESVGEVLANWEDIKSAEKSRKTLTDKLTSIPRQFPALMRAAKVGKKAKALDFPDAASVAEKLREELAEAEAAIAAGDEKAVFEEMGDLLLSAASLARFAGVDPEHALSAATDKFIARFALVEEFAIEEGADLVSMSDVHKHILWQKAKKIAKR